MDGSGWLDDDGNQIVIDNIDLTLSPGEWRIVREQAKKTQSISMQDVVKFTWTEWERSNRYTREEDIERQRELT
jgi:hypothetical protein